MSMTGSTALVSCGGGGGKSSVISNAAVSTAAGDQHMPDIAADGNGGAVVAWMDERSTWSQVYSQRINASSGNGLWATNGTAVRASVGTQYYPQVVYDGSESSIYIWADTLNYICGNWVYAQKLTLEEGTPQWGSSGVRAISGGISTLIKAVPDGMGGVVFTGMDVPCIPGNSAVFAQRLSAVSGTPLWGGGGVELCSTTQNPQEPEIAPDGNGGAVVAWYDARNGDNDIYAQRSDALTGAPQWTLNGIAVSATSGEQMYPQIVLDGAGGVIIAWQDSRNGDYDIYAQRIDIASGTPQWAEEGVAVCVTTGDQVSPMLAPDGEGGAVITWQDGRSGDDNIYAQRLSMAAGTTLWTPGGLLVCGAAMDQGLPRITSDADGSMIITWEDLRNGADYDIYAQKVNTASGACTWDMGGVAVNLRSGDQTDPRLVTNGTGGAIIVWVDDSMGDDDIYAQELRADGSK
jgi:hypothetical protein